MIYVLLPIPQCSYAIQRYNYHNELTKHSESPNFAFFCNDLPSFTTIIEYPPNAPVVVMIYLVVPLLHCPYPLQRPDEF